jgi:threo-3-hydroxy-L-aspartate ammonia-lyase
MSAASESSTETLTVTYADILAAAERLRPYTYHTPVQHSRSFDAEAGMVIWLKCEQFQRSGVFKFRGACG